MEKDSFVFRKEWRDAISGLPDEVRLEFYEAVIEYGISGRTTELKQMARLAFNFAKAALDSENERYESICKTNRENGRKGGRPRKTQKPNGFLENPNNRTVFSETQKTERFPYKELLLEPNGSITNSNNNIINIKKDSAYAEPKEIGDTSPLTAEPSHGIDHTKFMLFFNETVAGSSIPPIKTMNKARCAMLNARAKEHGEDALREAVKKAAASSFLNGGGDRCFIATFDWIFKPTNFPKVLEGNYDNRNYNNGNTINSIRANVEDAKRCAIRSTQEFIDKARSRRNSL